MFMLCSTSVCVCICASGKFEGLSFGTVNFFIQNVKHFLNMHSLFYPFD